MTGTGDPLEVERLTAYHASRERLKGAEWVARYHTPHDPEEPVKPPEPDEYQD